MSATAGDFRHHCDDHVAHLEQATWEQTPCEHDQLELPSELSTPARARAWARGALPCSRLSGAEHDDVALLISELVTNAVRHSGSRARGTLTVRLAASEDCIRIEVSDCGAGFAPTAIPRPSPDAPGGRGLFLVDAIASRWGVSLSDRHCVWLERDR